MYSETHTTPPAHDGNEHTKEWDKKTRTGHSNTVHCRYFASIFLISINTAVIDNARAPPPGHRSPALNKPAQSAPYIPPNLPIHRLLLWLQPHTSRKDRKCCYRYRTILITQRQSTVNHHHISTPKKHRRNRFVITTYPHSHEWTFQLVLVVLLMNGREAAFTK